MQLISIEIRNWWKDWEVRLIILFSAFLQLVLITQGIRRKSMYPWRLKAVVWSTYLAAEWAAVVALGVLSNRLSDIKEKTGLSPNDQLTAFWAPFLLIHLGGTDSITAYSLEDNELWLRSTATLVAKTGLTVYIYFLALTGSPLSVLAATMIVVGFVKYGERTLALYKASKDNMRDSMLSPPDSGPIYPRIMERYSLKKDEGYQVAVDKVVEIAMPEDVSANTSSSLSDDEKSSTFLQAHSLFKIFKLLFVDLILSVSDLGNSKSLFTAMDSESAFEIVAIELGFMYDLLYTKAALIYGVRGIALRACTLSLTSAVLVFFTVQEWKKYKRVDICVTFALLGVAILVEFHSILRMVASDRTRVWLLKNKNRNRAKLVGLVRLGIYVEPRWSKLVSQFSLLRLSLRKEWRLARTIPRLGKLEKAVQKHFSITYKEFRNNMKDWIYKHMKEKVGNRGGTSSISFDAGVILRRNDQHHMTWSTDNIEFDQCILIWHIATELCYSSDRGEMLNLHGEQKTNYEMSRVVSRYLLHLLVMHATMLPTGIGQLRYADTSLEARKFFEEKKSLLRQNVSKESETGINDPSIGFWNWKGKDKEKLCAGCQLKHKHAESQALCEASHWLLEVKTEISPSVMRGGKSKSVLFDACRLVSELKAMGSAKARWNLINKVWAEALLYSAFCCDGYEHAKRLSQGGELLSHVWLLLAHFGIAKQVHSSQGHAIAKLLAE